ncbi:hypothetical protein J3F83DRAFT_728675 [Trichoderma novae-zelandiae]
MNREMLFKLALLLLGIIEGIRTYYNPAHRELFRHLFGITTEGADDSSTIFARLAPKTSEPTIMDEPWDGRRYAVPWPGNKYHIFLRGTDQVICSNSDGKFHMCDINKDKPRLHTWSCVENDGYFGFSNTQTGKFIGHKNDGLLHSTASHHRDWELMTARRHPEGGYELLMPYWSHTLKKVRVLDGSRTLLVKRDGTTLWQFVKVD